MGNYFTKKEQIAILIIAFIIIIALGFKFIMGNMVKLEEDELEILNFLEETENIDENNPTDEISDIIMVHISGEVYKPGLVELKQGQRVIDAVELAGGLKKDADLDKINLAKKVADEEKIYIPRIGEEISGENIISVEVGINSVDTSPDKININNCTKEELMTLPGIGTVIADKILQYRETSPFNTIEDLMNVSGIGEKKFEGLKELIRTN